MVSSLKLSGMESAKTTWITLAYVLRCAVEGLEKYILLLSDSEDQAEKYERLKYRITERGNHDQR